jgi:tRNA A37 N6-isopentenylltransferase MiaA
MMAIRTFFIVGPTATGKSELAADVARETGAEIVSADAFQIYRGLGLLTAKPERSTLAKAPHHLIGTVSLSEEMNAEKFRRFATRAIEEINSRGKLAIVVGGSGLYTRALIHGLASLPEPDPKLRAKLNAISLDGLRSHLSELDPETAEKIDLKNRRRLTRALEICLLTGKPVSASWAVAASLCEAQRCLHHSRCASHRDAATVSRNCYGVFLSLLRTPAASAEPLRQVVSARNRYHRPCPQFAPCEFDPLGTALSRRFSPDTLNRLRRVPFSVRQ